MPWLHRGKVRRWLLLGGPSHDREYDSTGLHVETQVEGMAYIQKVVLMAPASLTHHADMSARYIELESTAISEKPGHRAFVMPTETEAPRGYYMLWAITDGGVPSEAVWVRIRQ